MRGSEHVEPEIGSWYDSKNVPESFVVLDEGDDYIQIQYLDGELDRIDYDSWDAMHMRPVAEPEDATAGYEMEHEDMLNLLNDLEESQDVELEDHLRYIDSDDSEWR